MNHRKLFQTFAVIAAAMWLAPCAHAQDFSSPAQDPPGRVARIAFAQGNVSLQPAGVDPFSQAELNYPLTAGDRVYADNNSQAELETSGLAIRLGNGADLTLSSLTDAVAQFGLAQGSIRVRTRDLNAPPGADGTPQQGLVEIDTPNGAVLVQSPGDIRVDSYPQDDSTVVTVSSGQVEVTGPNLDQVIGPNQAVRFVGNPVIIQPVGLPAPDPLDQLDLEREAAFNAALDVRDDYVSPEMIGAADLDRYGQWDASADYGEVWYPSYVALGWAPYQNGRWAWIAPWGWTWIEAEPWGFAPFHYGRWTQIDSRWGWIPGPPPTVWGRPVRPVYSPALVVFVGAGAGLTAWFPLGPGEPYQPWYHASALYVNRINVTNLYSRNTVQLRSAFNDRASVVFDVYADAAFVNRPVATTAIAQRDFAAGRSVAAAPLRLDAVTRAQLAQAPLLPHPLITPTAAMAAPQMPARAIPPNPGRPALATREGIVPPEASMAPAQVQPAQPARGSLPEQRTAQRAQPAASVPAPAVPAQPRPLVTHTPPQPAQPSFAEQQREIQRVDPGRPLGPQQVENVRAGRPAGPASQPEPAPHPRSRAGSPADAPEAAAEPLTPWESSQIPLFPRHGHRLYWADGASGANPQAYRAARLRFRPGLPHDPRNSRQALLPHRRGGQTVRGAGLRPALLGGRVSAAQAQ